MKRIYVVVLVFFVICYGKSLDMRSKKEFPTDFILLTQTDIDSLGFSPWFLGFPFKVDSEVEPVNVLLQITYATDTLKTDTLDQIMVSEFTTLLDTVLPNGNYEYRWKDDGMPFESGLYFYKFKIGDSTFVNKITIIK